MSKDPDLEADMALVREDQHYFGKRMATHIGVVDVAVNDEDHVRKQLTDAGWFTGFSVGRVYTDAHERVQVAFVFDPGDTIIEHVAEAIGYVTGYPATVMDERDRSDQA